MATDAPPVSQHLSALQRANAIRLGRAHVKRDVASGAKTVRDVLEVHEVPGVSTLEDVHPVVASMTIGELLCVPRRWGICRMRRLLADCRIGEHVRLDALTDRQRRSIVARFEGRVNATAVELARRAEREAARERREAASRARRARDAERRAEAERQAAEQLRAVAEAERRAREPVDPLDVECPNCRSGPGDVCSWYDPVNDVWVEPRTPCADRLKRAGLLS
jgi:hypothetical protein